MFYLWVNMDDFQINFNILNFHRTSGGTLSEIETTVKQ